MINDKWWMSDEWWVMSDEWWVTSDEWWWVMMSDDQDGETDRLSWMAESTCRIFIFKILLFSVSGRRKGLARLHKKRGKPFPSKGRETHIPQPRRYTTIHSHTLLQQYKSKGPNRTLTDNTIPIQTFVYYRAVVISCANRAFVRIYVLRACKYVLAWYLRPRKFACMKCNLIFCGLPSASGLIDEYQLRRAPRGVRAIWPARTRHERS